MGGKRKPPWGKKREGGTEANRQSKSDAFVDVIKLGNLQ